jgi:CheY-like chemotaxis protein
MSKSKILIVDDNRHLRVTLTVHLKHEGYEPSEADIVEAFEGAGFETAVLHSATDAIVHASSHAPQAILMKQFLPGMSGAAVAPILGAMPGTREIPIVLYDESRRHDNPRLFLSRIPDGVTRCVAGNQGEELLRMVRQVFAR